MTLKVEIMSDLHIARSAQHQFPPLAPGADLILVGGDRHRKAARAARGISRRTVCVVALA